MHGLREQDSQVRGTNSRARRKKKTIRASLGRPPHKRTDLACSVQVQESQQGTYYIKYQGTASNQPTGRNEEEPAHTDIEHGIAAPHRERAPGPPDVARSRLATGKGDAEAGTTQLNMI